MKKKIFILSENTKPGYNAGSKARQDVSNILRPYFPPVGEMYEISGRHGRLLKTAIANYKLYNRLKYEKIMKGDYLLIQFPPPRGKRLLPYLNKRFKCVYLIHDLDGLRELKSRHEKRDIRYLKKGYLIISHNKHMKNRCIWAV